MQARSGSKGGCARSASAWSTARDLQIDAAHPRWHPERIPATHSRRAEAQGNAILYGLSLDSVMSLVASVPAFLPLLVISRRFPTLFPNTVILSPSRAPSIFQGPLLDTFSTSGPLVSQMLCICGHRSQVPSSAPFPHSPTIYKSLFVVVVVSHHQSLVHVVSYRLAAVYSQSDCSRSLNSVALVRSRQRTQRTRRISVVAFEPSCEYKRTSYIDRARQVRYPAKHKTPSATRFRPSTSSPSRTLSSTSGDHRRG